MWTRRAAVAAACLLASLVSASPTSAQPAPDPGVQPVSEPAPPPVAGGVPSGAPGVLDTADGWRLTVAGSQETQLPVAPLTTAVSSREYLVGGTFTGTVTGGGSTTLAGGTLEAGQQIGCGIISDETEINPSAGITPAIPIPFNDEPTFGSSLSLQGKVYLKPGTVTTVALEKKTFKGTSARITLSGVRVKTDQCAGQSFIRSYATLTSSTANTDDIITYLGVTKVV